MKMKQLPNRDQKKHIVNIKGGVIPLLGVALIIVLLTAAVYFVANYVAEFVLPLTAVVGVSADAWPAEVEVETLDIPLPPLRTIQGVV